MGLCCTTIRMTRTFWRQRGLLLKMKRSYWLSKRCVSRSAIQSFWQRSPRVDSPVRNSFAQLIARLQLPRRHALRIPTHREVHREAQRETHTERTHLARPSKKRRSQQLLRGKSAHSANGCLPASLLRLLRLALLNRAELLSLLGRDESADVTLAAPVSGRNEMAVLRQLLAILREKLVRLDGRVDDAHSASVVYATIVSDGESTSAPTTDPKHWEILATVYLKQQRDMLQHAIAECKSRLHAVAAATTRLQSSSDWRMWDYAPESRRRSDSSNGVLVIELPLSASRWDAHTDAVSCNHAMSPSDRNICATSDVPAGGACFSVPSSELITAKAALEAGEWGELLSTVDGIDEDVTLMLFLIHEKCKCSWEGRQDGQPPPQWLEFLQHPLLHASSGNLAPCGWNAAERALLDGTEAGELIEEAVARLAELHEALFPALTDAYPQAFPAVSCHR